MLGVIESFVGLACYFRFGHLDLGEVFPDSACYFLILDLALDAEALAELFSNDILLLIHLVEVGHLNVLVDCRVVHISVQASVLEINHVSFGLLQLV